MFVHSSVEQEHRKQATPYTLQFHYTNSLVTFLWQMIVCY